MKVKNINIYVQYEDGIKYIKILDADTNEILCKGDAVDVHATDIFPVCAYNNIKFIGLPDNSIWMSFEDVKIFINKPEEAKTEENGHT